MTLTNSEAWAFLVSLVMPVVVSTLKSPEWPRWMKVGLALGLSALAGFGTAYFDNQLVFTWEKAVIDAAIIFGGAQVVYLRWFQGTQAEQTLRDLHTGN